MSWLPGWDSITSVSRYHEIFWWFGIACLVLLVGSEIIAKMYADRKDELLADREGAVSERPQQDARQAEHRDLAELVELMTALARQQAIEGDRIATARRQLMDAVELLKVVLGRPEPLSGEIPFDGVSPRIPGPGTFPTKIDVLVQGEAPRDAIADWARLAGTRERDLSQASGLEPPDWRYRH